MPKGAHFKKDNPRNYQVSFKVNQTELAQLKELAAAQNLSIPEWIRTHIHGTATPMAKQVVETTVEVKEETQPIPQPAKKKPATPKPKTSPASQSQTSLF